MWPPLAMFRVRQLALSGVRVVRCRRQISSVKMLGTNAVVPSTDQRRTVPMNKNTSIFDNKESAWEYVLNDTEPSTSKILSSHTAPRKNRRQALTAQEMNVFNDMFDAVFAAAATADGGAPSAQDPLAASASIRKRSSDFTRLAYQLERQNRRVKWTTEAEEELDRKMEDMDLCENDQHLLDWAMREVFEESQRYENAAREAASSPQQEPAHLQPPSYPHLVASLMRTFRDDYSDPHLALAIFDYARNLSIASYVLGCTTPVYNELIYTRWRCFRDLRGVCDALEEMRVNGIEIDMRTRGIAEAVRREVGERNFWEEESSIGSGEVWTMLQRIERLIAREASKGRVRKQGKKWSKDSEVWQIRALQDSVDGWEFGRWEEISGRPVAL